MQEREIIHHYLTSFSRYLSRLEKADADDVLREIESHIYDVMESREKDELEIDAKSILAGFGEPRELAAQYVDHIIGGSPPPKGFRAIQRVKKGATKGLYLATAFWGYGISLALTMLALYKPFAPLEVGLWSQGVGRTLILGIVSPPPEGTYEVLGWWIIPLALGLALSIAYLTKRLLSVLKMQI